MSENQKTSWAPSEQDKAAAEKVREFLKENCESFWIMAQVKGSKTAAIVCVHGEVLNIAKLLKYAVEHDDGSNAMITIAAANLNELNRARAMMFWVDALQKTGNDVLADFLKS